MQPIQTRKNLSSRVTNISFQFYTEKCAFGLPQLDKSFTAAKRTIHI